MQAHGRLSAAASPDDLAVAVLAALQGGFLLGQVHASHSAHPKMEGKLQKMPGCCLVNPTRNQGLWTRTRGCPRFGSGADGPMNQTSSRRDDPAPRRAVDERTGYDELFELAVMSALGA
jgi:hypothetical protein